MLSAVLTWFASKGVGLLLGAIFGAANEYATNRKAEQAQRDAGAAEAAAATNKETSDANRRAADAAVNSDRGDAADDKLISGDRQF